MTSTELRIGRHGAWRTLALLALLTLSTGMAQAVMPKLSASFSHTLALQPDGTLWAWGSNAFGALGDSGTVSRGDGRKVSGLPKLRDIAAGSNFSVALGSDGRLYAWGSNAYGQLGMGSGAPAMVSIPTQVPSLSSVVAVAAGSSHVVALKSDGTVWTWGYNGEGQLGAGTYSSRSVPTMLTTIDGVTAVAAGKQLSMALKSDGSVLTWGSNDWGQIGDGGTARRPNPTNVSGLANVRAVATSGDHCLALLAGGVVRAWGRNSNGQLGDGSYTDRRSPVVVTGLSGMAGIAAGSRHSMALDVDGMLVAWGDNSVGELGIGTTTGQGGGANWPSPIAVSAFPGGVPAMAAGDQASYVYAPDGRVMAAGLNINYNLGDGTVANRSNFVEAGIEDAIIGVSAGNQHALAVRADGRAVAWGYNGAGQLGDGTTTDRSSPVFVAGLTDVVAVAAGKLAGDHSLALRADGTVWAWGDNSFGELGDGSHTERHQPVPVLVTLYPSVLTAPVTGVTAIAAGGMHSLALHANGTVSAWGSNTCGQLGDGSTSERTTAVSVSGLASVVAIAAGVSHSLALKSDGTLWAWGCNEYGQLGVGQSPAFSNVPLQVTYGALHFSSIAAGNYHSLGTSTNHVYAWGLNTYGQLALPLNNTMGHVPYEVSGGPNMDLGGYLSPASDCSGCLAAGGNYSMVIMANDATIEGWGDNRQGQLANGFDSMTSTPTPGPVGALTNVRAVSAGYNFGVALKADHSMSSWGSNEHGVMAISDVGGVFPYELTVRRVDDGFPAGGVMPRGWHASPGSAIDWVVVPPGTTVTFAGPSALISPWHGLLADGAMSGISYSGHFREGFVSFARRVSSEANGDYLRFYIDGVLKGEWSGDVPWDRAGAFVPAGRHTFTWQYEKNASGSGGSDRGEIDDVRLPPEIRSLTPVLMMLFD